MSASSLNALEKRTAVSLACVFAFRMLGLFMLMPVLAIYGTELEGFSPLWIGIAIGAYGLTQALLQIPMGWLSDKFGRKRVIVAGLIMFAIGSVIAAMAESIYTVTLGRALQGMGAIAAAVLALAADLSRDEQRPKVMAVIGMCIGLSFAAAMLLGPMIAASFGVSGIFWLTACLAVLGIFIVLTVVPTAVNRAPKGDTSASLNDIKNLVKHPQLVRLNLGVMLLHLTLTAVFVALPAELIKDGLAAEMHWKLYIPVLLLAFVFMVPMMIVAIKKQKEKMAFLVSIALIVASLMSLSLFGSSALIIGVCMLIYFIAFNFLEATMPALVARISPAGQKGSAMGAFSSTQFLGAFLGGIIGGYFAQVSDAQTVFAAATLVGVIWFAIAWGMEVPPKSKLISLLTELQGEKENFDPEKAAEKLANDLADLPGVLETTVVLEENRTYLKVKESEFDLQQAKAVAGIV